MHEKSLETATDACFWLLNAYILQMISFFLGEGVCVPMRTCMRAYVAPFRYKVQKCSVHGWASTVHE